MSARCARRGIGDEGQVTAFVVIMVTAIIFIAGLVLDGGNVLAAKRQAGDEAESAARAGAQALDIDAARSAANAHRLDPDAAAQAVQDYVSRTGHRVVGAPQVDCDTVTVTVAIDQPLYILGIGGLGTQTVLGTASARNERGVGAAEGSTC